MRRSPLYRHERPDWPKFRWDREALAVPLAEIRHRQGRLLGRMEGLGCALQKEAELETLTLDVLESSEIEGEKLSPGQVRSAIARRLSLDAGGAEPADRDIARFLAWTNKEDGDDAVLRAGLAHLWFVTIHPFDDGNGSIARAIPDWQLARSENSVQRFYSMSAQIRHERNDYYDTLERTPKGTLDVTLWLAWFLGCLGRAFDGTETTLAAVLRKARFWERAARLAIDNRQRNVLNQLLDGFTGTLTTQKWAALAKCSHDTSLRDIQGLIDHGLLKKDQGGGRSTSYSLDEG